MTAVTLSIPSAHTQLVHYIQKAFKWRSGSLEAILQRVSTDSPELFVSMGTRCTTKKSNQSDSLGESYLKNQNPLGPHYGLGGLLLSQKVSLWAAVFLRW